MTTTVNLDFPSDTLTTLYRVDGSTIYFYLGADTVAPTKVIYEKLLGINNNFTAVWADPATGKDNGNIYLATSSAVFVLNAATKTQTDYYAANVSGKSGDSLDGTDITDINKV